MSCDARHDRGGLGGRRLRGRQRRLHRQPPPGPGQPGAAARRTRMPESLQYVTVYSNGQKGGFAGSEPVANPENFRCAFNKTPGRSTSRSLRDAWAGPDSCVPLPRSVAARGPGRPLALVVLAARGSARGDPAGDQRSTGPSEDIVGFGGVAMAEDGTGGARLSQARRRRRARVRRALRRRPLARADPRRRRTAVRRQLAAHRRRRRRRARWSCGRRRSRPKTGSRSTSCSARRSVPAASTVRPGDDRRPRHRAAARARAPISR